MLPFGLKLAWFVASLVGTIASAFVLNAFAKNVGSYWGPCYFSVAQILLQVSLCIGMIYHMDPTTAPASFCIVQMSLINLSAYMLVAINGVFVVATSMTVLGSSSSSNDSIFRWRHRYIIPLGVFPVVMIIILICVSLKTGSWKATDGMQCDNNSPEWVRFIGYAGTPLVVSIPSAILSSFTISRIFATYRRQVQQISRFESYTSAADRPHVDSGYDDISSPPLAIERMSYTRAPRAPIADVTDRRRQNHLSSSMHHPGMDFVTPSPYSIHSRSFERKDSFNGKMSAISIDTTQMNEQVPMQSNEGGLDSPNSTTYLNSLRHQPTTPISPSEPEVLHTTHALQAIWRLVLFNVSFLLITLLLSISTIADIAMKRPEPSPFGTQHVAALATQWGPVFVFGHSPGIRRHLWPRSS